MARPLLRKPFMQPTRITILLVGALLSGCVGGYPLGGYSGGYSPFYGSQPYYGSRPYYGSQPYYGNRYDGARYPYYGDRYYGRDWRDDGYNRRAARELAEDQARARERLRREQLDRRENLIERQQDRREIRQDTDSWRKRNVRYQRQQRQTQQERFRREREAQRKRQGRAWDD